MSHAAQTALAALPPDRAELAFEPKRPHLKAAEALVEANRCLFCEDAPCTKACPADIDVPGFIRRIATGNVKGAAKKILSKNIMGLSCGTVCPVQELCEGACVYHYQQQPPVQIGVLQHFAVATTFEKSGFPLTPKAATGKKIAVIGSGPGGLSAAAELRLLGHTPVVFEARAYPGGLNTYGVAPYKISAKDALEELSYIERLGIEIRTNCRVGRDVKGAELLRDYAAVVVACGLGEDGRPDIPGVKLPGVWGATELVEALKLKAPSATKGVHCAVVIGGGNTALDCVQELKLLGVPQVWLTYRRSEADMPGYRHEWHTARGLGVGLLERVTPIELGGSERVTSIAFTVGGKPDQKMVVDCELVVLAVGQAKQYPLCQEFLGMTAKDGKLTVDERMMTGHKGVFACGDAINGGKEVVNAAAEAKRAALAIDRYLTL